MSFSAKHRYQNLLLNRSPLTNRHRKADLLVPPHQLNRKRFRTIVFCLFSRAVPFGSSSHEVPLPDNQYDTSYAFIHQNFLTSKIHEYQTQGLHPATASSRTL